MDNDTPKIQPDYGFILNQQSSAPKKGLDKKGALILAGLALVVVLGVLGLVMSVTNNVNNDAKLATPADEAKQVIVTFDEAVKAKDFTKAAEIVDVVGDERPALTSDFTNLYTKLFDPATCQITTGTSGSTSTTQQIKHICTSYDKKVKLTYTFTVAKAGDHYVITARQFGSAWV